MPEASADDVKVGFETDLSDIDAILDKVEREWQREYDTDRFADTAHIKDFEAALAQLRIVEGPDRRASDVTSGRTSVTYETEQIANIRSRVRRLDPGNEFGHPGHVRVDDDRHISTT